MDELLAILKVAEEHDPQDRLAMAMAYWHGLRASEVCTATRDNLVDGHVDMQRLKGSRRTVQKFVKHTNPLLDEHTGLMRLSRTLKKGQPLFPQIATRFQFTYRMLKYGRLAGIARPKQKTHIFKHSIAKHTIRKAGIENVRVHLGHVSIASTGAYLEVDQEEAAQAIADAMGAEI